MHSATTLQMRQMWRTLGFKVPTDNEPGEVDGTMEGQHGSMYAQVPKPPRMPTIQCVRKLADKAVSGWWVLLAEVLAVVVLLVLAVVAGAAARQTSVELDAWALAAVARQDPRTLCLNATSDITVGRMLRGPRLHLHPVFKGVDDGLEGVEYEYLGYSYQLWYADSRRDPGTLSLPGQMPASIWAWPAEASELFKDLVIIRERLAMAAMWQCNVIVGGYTADDLVAYTGGNVKTGDIPRLSAQTTLVFKDNGKLPRTQLSEATKSYLTSRDGFSGTAHAFFPPQLDGFETRMPGAKWNTTYYTTGSSWPDPGTTKTNVPPGMLRLFPLSGEPVYGPPRIIPLSSAGKDDFGKTVDNYGTLWLQFGPQNATTARCMAQAYPHLTSMFETHCNASDFDIYISDIASDGKCPVLEKLWVELFGDCISAEGPTCVGNDSLPYACSGGIDVTSYGAASALSKHTAYANAAKNQYSVNLFAVMRNLNYDDVYAVYTAVLGALFGSVALLVATLFVLVLAFFWYVCFPTNRERYEPRV